MRSVTLTTCLAIFALSAGAAMAQAKGDLSGSDPAPTQKMKPDTPPASSAGAARAQADADAPVSPPDAAPEDKSGYDAKAAAKKKTPKSPTRPGYYQRWEQPGGNDAGNLVPFNSPR